MTRIGVRRAFRISLRLERTTNGRPYRLAWITIMLVGVDVLDDPPTIVFCFLTAVKKRYTFVFRVVEDVDPYGFAVGYYHARRGAACCSRLFLRTVEDACPYSVW